MIRVLIAAGEEQTRRELALLLTGSGEDCIPAGFAPDTDSALAFCRERKPELVTAALNLPGGGGLGLLERLRREGFPGEVILFAETLEPEPIRKALRLGAADYLTLPPAPGELRAALGRLRERFRPDRTPGPAAPEPPENRHVRAAMAYVAEHYGDRDLSIGAVARGVELSESYLSHLFRRETGQTLKGYLTAYRVSAAMELLRRAEGGKLYELAQQVGYQDEAYFSNVFKRLVGRSPSEFLR